MTIHKEGKQTLMIGLIVLILIGYLSMFSGVWGWIVWLLAFGIYLLLISFFRHPERVMPSIMENELICPADGKVVVVEKTTETEYLKAECVQVSIFMSPLNVHVNRHPISGTISYYRYHAGKYLAAWNPKASTENERTSIGYIHKGKKLLVRQIAGALARRIVCYAEEGQTAKKGEEMGFIKLGSRVDLYLPPESEILVKEGDVVQGNITKIAKI